MLRSPCESLVKYVLPALRSMLVYHMYVEKEMSQLQIARLTGMSQSTVSRYLNNERGLYKSIIAKLPGVEEVLDEIASRLEERGDVSICTACKLLEERGLLEDALMLIKQAQEARRSSR